MSIEVMKQALEALEWNYNTDLDNIPAYVQWAKMLQENITALRAALAEPNRAEKMRAAGYTRRPTLRELAYSQTTHWEGCEAVHPECRKPEQAEQYTEAQQIEDAIVYGSAWSKDGKRIDPMSVYKNTEQAEQQEPVAWIEHIAGGVEYNPYHKAALKLPEGMRFDLYTTPPQRKPEPLSDDEIAELMMKAWGCASIAPRHAPAFARAIEAVVLQKNGIGGGE
jgi:hypothetical protein